VLLEYFINAKGIWPAIRWVGRTPGLRRSGVSTGNAFSMPIISWRGSEVCRSEPDRLADSFLQIRCLLLDPTARTCDHTIPCLVLSYNHTIRFTSTIARSDKHSFPRCNNTIPNIYMMNQLRIGFYAATESFEFLWKWKFKMYEFQIIIVRYARILETRIIQYHKQ
jgi:hypothetical protein